MLKPLRFFIALLALNFVASVAFADGDIEFILDISGSMQQKLNGESQIDSARAATLNALNEIKINQLVALRVYGHRVDQSKKEESCKDTELLIPFKQLDKQEFSAKIQDLTPRGYTPIAYSLEQSRNDLIDVGMGREAERVIILMTDGEETCGGDPIAVLKKLREEGFRLKVFTVGFNVNDIARKQLKDIADFSGGKYFDAKNGLELKNALSEATKETVVLLEKKKSTYGSEIRGGDSYETAKPIETDKEYRLDHHQKVNDYDYFFLDGVKGDEFTITLTTFEKGIFLKADGKAQENESPYAGLELHEATRSKVKAINIIGGRSKAETIVYRPKEAARFYLLVGNIYEAMHKDQVTFKIAKTHKGDLGTDNDAGDDPQTALPISAQRYATSIIGDVDEFDTFSLDAKKGEKYVFGVIPNNKQTGGFAIRCYDEFKQNILTAFAASDSGLKSDEIEIPEDGTYYLEIRYQNDNPMDYALIVKKKDAPPSAIEGGQTSGGNAGQ